MYLCGVSAITLFEFVIGSGARVYAMGFRDL